VTQSKLYVYTYRVRGSVIIPYTGPAVTYHTQILLVVAEDREKADHLLASQSKVRFLCHQVTELLARDRGHESIHGPEHTLIVSEYPITNGIIGVL
jgi:hypothetical protein